VKKALVIGGSGFIGSHVADSLSRAGYDVFIYDLVESPWMSKDQTMIVGDITNSRLLSEAINGSKVVYNFAALADLELAQNKPLETIEINILGNARILELCRLANINRYIFASTVYVNSREGGFYRRSKQAAESYVEEYGDTYGLNYTILRYGSLYGPRSDKTNGLHRIIEKALKTGALSYEGHIDAMREYVHAYDAANASVTALGPEFLNQSLVITGQEPIKVIDLLNMLAEILGLKQDSIEFIASQKNGHYVRTPYAYNSKISKKFIPPLHVDLGQGLLHLIEVVCRMEG
jgi:UDP-glucose 4-epimerase